MVRQLFAILMRDVFLILQRRWFPVGAMMFVLSVTGFTPLTSNAAPSSDGLYATFQIHRGGTPVGEFICRLEFEKVPKTVANFVGLAEGSLPFVDFVNGHVVRRPFYDGLTFHRVVNQPTPFVIQAGSPKGDGNDGPGYTFPDEFDPTLRHDKAGMLSMANSGLNSNGSQFFVTLAATPWLDDVHSVFGEVLEGMDTVNAVQQGDVIHNITITRIGSAATDFDPTVHGVPSVADADPALEKIFNGFHLNYSRPGNTEHFVFHSENLESWTQLAGKELEGPTPENAPRDVSAIVAGKASHFFTVGRVQYPNDIHTPASLEGSQLILSDGSGLTLSLAFPTGAAATYSIQINTDPAGTFPINSHEWKQEAYRGRFTGDLFNNPGFGYGNGPVESGNISFVFDSPTSGTAKGYFVNTAGQRYLLSGPFALSSLD